MRKFERFFGDFAALKPAGGIIPAIFNVIKSFLTNFAEIFTKKTIKEMPSTSAALSAGSIVKGPRASFRIVSVYQQTPYSITYIAENMLTRFSTGNKATSAACGLPNFSGYCLLKEFFWREACVRDTESDAVLLSSDSDSVILRFNDLCDSFISKGRAVDSAIFEICDSVLYRGRETKIATPVVFEANNTAYAVFDVNPKVQFRPADYVRSRGAMPAANLKELFEPLLFEMGAVSQAARTAFFSGDEGGLMLPGRTLFTAIHLPLKPHRQTSKTICAQLPPICTSCSAATRWPCRSAFRRKKSSPT